MSKVLNTVHWKKYLDINNGNPQVKKFLESRGNDVLWQIAQNVHKSGRNSQDMKDELVMVIHENAPNAILIEKKDYLNILDLCLKWFEKYEYYEKCSEILTFKKDIVNNITKINNIHKHNPKKHEKLI